MIKVEPRWAPTRTTGKEREQGAEGEHLFVEITFSGIHYLPIEEIPSRVIGMENGQFAAVPEQDSLSTIVFDTGVFPIMGGGEMLVDGKRATRIVRPVNRPQLGEDDFMNVTKFGENLARYAGEIEGKKMQPQQIPGFTEFEQQMEIYQEANSSPQA